MPAGIKRSTSVLNTHKNFPSLRERERGSDWTDRPTDQTFLSRFKSLSPSFICSPPPRTVVVPPLSFNRFRGCYKSRNETFVQTFFLKILGNHFMHRPKDFLSFPSPTSRFQVNDYFPSRTIVIRDVLLVWKSSFLLVSTFLSLLSFLILFLPSFGQSAAC